MCAEFMTDTAKHLQTCHPHIVNRQVISCIMGSDSDDSGSDDRLLCPALPVGKMPQKVDLSVPPSSAEEYLHQVMYEAKKCDSVVTVEVDRKKLKKVGPQVKPLSKVAAPPGYAPSLQTQKDIIKSFTDVREHIAKLREGNIPKPPFHLPGKERMEEWCKICFGNSYQLSLLQKTSVSTPKPDLVEGKKPLLSIVLNIKQPLIQQLLEWHVQWLEVLNFTESQGQWLYALLACIEKPLTPENCSHIRSLACTCASLRANLDNPGHPFLPHLNVLICIVSRYFNQEDLADC
ncbi:gemin 2 isoform X2 [Oratosquilla oratoria]